MSNYKSNQAKILTNITYNTKLNKALSYLGLRLFYADKLYIAWDVDTFDLLHKSNEKCTTYFKHKNTLKLLFAYNEDFSILIEFQKLDKFHYTYKSIEYYDRKKCEKYLIKIPEHVKTLKKRID
jgi:hypothetical protein